MPGTATLRFLGCEAGNKLNYLSVERHNCSGISRVGRTSGLVLLATVLAACSGGGGSDSGGTTPPPTNPGGNDPPPVLEPVKLMPQGYQYTVQAVGPLLDLTMQLGQLAAITFSVREATAGTAQYAESCESGQITVDLVDNDRNQQLSAGDRMVLRFASCVSGDATTNAVLNIDVASLTETIAQNVIDLRLTIESFTVRADNITTTITGGVNNLWTAGPSSDRFVITGARLATSGYGSPKRIENFTVDLTQNYSTYEYRLTWRGDVAAEGLGTFRFDTDAVMLGQLGRYPEAGAWTIYGDQSAVRLEEGAYGETLPGEVGLVQDFDGDGIFVPARVSLLWLEGFDMSMFDSFRPGVTLPADQPTIHVLKGRVVTLLSQPTFQALADIVVDPTRDTLYASSPASNEVVAVSTSTYHITDRIPVGSTPKDLYLPADASEVMVALNRGGAIARINPETRQFQRMETAVANNASAPEVIIGAGDAVYVTSFPSRTGQGIVPHYFAKGSRTTNAVERFADSIAPTVHASTELTADGRFLFTTEIDGNDTHLVKRDLSLPGAPIVASRTFTYMIDDRFALNPDGRTLVLARGEILRTSDFEQIATIQINDSVAFNADGSRMLAMFGHSMILYDAQKYITLRTFWPDCAVTSSGTKLAYVAAHDQWVALYDNKVCAVSLNDRLNPPGQAGGPAPPAPIQPVTLPVTVQNVFTPLNQNGQTILAAEIDRQRGVLYLGGMRDMAGEVAIVSLADLSTVATILLPSHYQPLSLTLNDDGDRLYVNQNGDGYRLEVIDTASASLLAPLAYPADLFGVGYGLSDAKWIGGDKLLMTTGSNGERVTMATLDVLTANGERIAGGEAQFTPGAKLIISADRTSAYTNGWLNSAGQYLQRIDLTQANPSVALTRLNEELRDSTFGTFSADGRLLHFFGGIVVNPQTFMLAGFTGEGMQIPTPDGATVYVLDRTRETLSVFDARTYQLRALYSVPGCFGQTVFAQLGSSSRDIVWTAGTGVCRVTVP